MEWSLIISIVSLFVAVIAIVVSIWLAKQNTKQIDHIYKEWDRKRKYSSDYNAQAEFQDNTRRNG